MTLSSLGKEEITRRAMISTNFEYFYTRMKKMIDWKIHEENN